MKIIKTSYIVLKSNDSNCWVLWKDVKTEKGMFCKPVYKGDKKTCFNIKKLLKKIDFSLYN